MKGFFSLLLLSNTIFFLWLSLEDQRQQVTSPYEGIPVASDGLVLLSELEENKRPAAHGVVTVTKVKPVTSEQTERVEPATDSESETASPSSVAGCYQSPPLDNLQDVELLQQRLAKHVEKSERKTVSVRQVNFWVQLPPYKNLDGAEKVSAQLKHNRIKDFFVVKTGQYQNAISLGVYSSKERAKERIAEIVALKVRIKKPVIEGLEMTVKQLVVQVSIGEQPLAEEVIGVLLKPGEEWKKIPCK